LLVSKYKHTPINVVPSSAPALEEVLKEIMQLKR
jgi:hypothetical protein